MRHEDVTQHPEGPPVKDSGTAPPPVREGTYVATDLASGLQIGCESFRWRETGDGYRLESRLAPFGGLRPVQRVEIHLDLDWIPRRMVVRSVAWDSLVVELGETRTRIRARRGAQEREMILPVGRREALLLLSDGYSFPANAVRRVSRDAPGPFHFRLIPEGVCRLLAVDGGPGMAGGCRLLEMRLAISGVEDRLHLLVDAAGDLIRLHARNRNLLVRLEGAGPPC
jgi:hypothetical protein